MTSERSVPSIYIVANAPVFLRPELMNCNDCKSDKACLDFAFLVQRFMSVTDEKPRSGGQLLVDEIDRVFNRVASGYLFSSWQIKTSMKDTPLDSVEELTHLFRRMQNCEAKWIIHLPLKDLSPGEVPEGTLQRFHALLTDHLKVCNTLPAALGSRSEGRIRRMFVSLRHGA